MATFHAFLALLVGIIFLVTDHKPHRVIAVAAYISGAEVLWRMVEAQIFWEYSKYAVALLMLLVLLKWRTRPNWTMLLYFLFLIPGALITFFSKDFAAARDDVSFNLSGPFALSLVALVACHLQINRRNFYRLSLAICGPILSVAVIAFQSTITTADIAFTNQSNFVTSGGYGPNQVSSLLSMGALLCWLVVLIYHYRRVPRWLFIALFLVYIGQAALTFSRGGLFNFLVAAVLPTLWIVRSGRFRAWRIAIVVFILLIGAFIIIPYLNQFTGDVFSQRVLNTSLTGRDILAADDLHTFLENPILGVGVGQSSAFRTSEFGRNVATHTEYTRIISEHGMLGLISFLFLLLAYGRAFVRNRHIFARSISLAFSLWAFACMSHAAMRIALIPLILGLAMASYNLTDENINSVQ